MTRKLTPKQTLLPLADALIEDWMTRSDEEILAEFREDGLDPEVVAAQLRAHIESLVAESGKSRLARARAGLASARADRASSSIYLLPISRKQEILAQFAANDGCRMIVLPFPNKILWPNGRGHWGAKARAFKDHKQWAYAATKAALPRCFKWNGEPILLRYTITPKTAHAIDRDNCVAAMKAYQDGIALALGIDDVGFAVPEIAFAAPRKPGGVEVAL